MNLAKQIEQEYREFVVASGRPWCWACGRSSVDRPSYWGAPFLIERAHVVSRPREDNRRAVILLCSICHKLTHGLRIAGVEEKPLSLPEMLWLKWRFDPKFYERHWLSMRHIGRLPRGRRPVPEIEAQYVLRRGGYPGG